MSTTPDAQIDFGLFHQMWAASDVSDAECIGTALEDVVLADSLGFHSCWFGEHHHGRHKAVFGRVPNPELLIARLIGETQRIRLGTGVKVLPLDTAERFAESITMLDLLASGRVCFGVGMAMRSDKLSEQHEKGALFRAQLDTLLRVLQNADGAAPDLTPAPQRDYRPLLWVAARDRETVAHAARVGVNFVVGQLEDADKQREYTACYRSNGGCGEVRGVRIVHVAESDQQAWTNVEKAVRRMYATRRTTAYGPLATAEGRMPAHDSEHPADMLAGVHVIAGTPACVAEQLGDYMQRSSTDRVDLMMHIPDVPRDTVRRSMVLFAEEVVPLLAKRQRAEGADGIARYA